MSADIIVCTFLSDIKALINDIIFNVNHDFDVIILDDVI